eukprot:CAMPEP_0113301216 /NCGR_PEP_ID=MMETSP0010_2-20120614/2536_1 /TAXON_ID=216773 ORGANISM="Corethron hystrix, Strain 308" /NCGR_SAMPLE_ID=MMETSP0010_2 /ASSEMBLY_ACC=CAM_ASM_000155 /LENGTH=166 /DNA_ID=CAMNT_0000154799 /DNA_START=66 /DNA_END=566 /DNA_ORIENTATION=+ /assembly_acc=CAM_ASM_000155
MADLIDAYDTLMDDDLGGRVGDSRVALACEMYALEELRRDGRYRVYDLRVAYGTDGTPAPNDGTPGNETRDVTSSEKDMSPRVGVMYEIEPHPDDSVWDLKRHLQDTYGAEWGLVGRRKSRDGISSGWELLSPDGAIMSYHLFLHTYRIKKFDVIHAVVGRFYENR